MEADVYKQQLDRLVMGSMGSRSLSRLRSVQKASPGLDSAGEAAAPGARVGRGTLWPLYWVQGPSIVPAIFNVKRGDRPLAGKSASLGSGPCSPETCHVTLVKSLLFSEPQFPFRFNEGIGEVAKQPSS